MPSIISSSSHLPSLTNNGLDSTSSSSSSPLSARSLRGNHHSRVPDISNQPLNTLLPVLKDGRMHPEPYYITQNVVFKVETAAPPWLMQTATLHHRTTERQRSRSSRSRPDSSSNLSELWERDEKFRQQVLEELIKDCIHMEVAGLVSGTMAEQRAKNDKEAFLHAWLEDQVVTDTVYAATEDIVWEALWDQARKLKPRQLDELERILSKNSKKSSKNGVDSHMLSVLRESYSRPLNAQTGASVTNKKWSELLYHTNRYMQRGSLMENYAIRKLQEQIICQIAAKVVLDEAVKNVEQEVYSLDQEERIDRPPKKVTLEKVNEAEEEESAD